MLLQDRGNGGYAWGGARVINARLNPSGADRVFVRNDKMNWVTGEADGRLTLHQVGADLTLSSLTLGESAIPDGSAPIIPSRKRDRKGKQLDSLLASLVGKYENVPVENDWHKVTIEPGDNGNLRWKNGAGISWTLELRNGNELWAGKDCPYGEMKLEIKKDDAGKVSGLQVGNGILRRLDYSPPKSPLRDSLVGKYENVPVENDWHKVTIETDAIGNLRWKNAAGVSWTLELRNGSELWAGKDCPYGEMQLEIKKDGAGKVVGLQVGNAILRRIK
jgi:hypothetical protein